MTQFIYAGDSWALKGFTNHNYSIGNNDPMIGDIRMADHWGIPYKHCLTPGKGNLSVLRKLLNMNIQEHIPIIWVYTEPGRDYGYITGENEFDWMSSEEIFSIRKKLDVYIVNEIKKKIRNPIAFIGGLSDVNEDLMQQHNFKVLHPSWQRWMAEYLNRTEYFDFGWGACDIGWRADYNNVKPSKTALFAWDELIKEWCMWEDLGFMCHEHPTPLSNSLFADFLRQDVFNWIESVKK